MLDDENYWKLLERLVSESEIIIDRPKGTCHPKFQDMIYPLNYGYLKNTTSMDRNGIDVFSGSLKSLDINGILCNVDILKKDSEIKILIGCTEEEIQIVHKWMNLSNYMKCIFIEGR